MSRRPGSRTAAVPDYKELIALVQSWLAVALAAGAVVVLLRYLDPAARRPFPPQRRRALPWTGPLVAAAFLVFFLLPSVIYPWTDAAAAAWLRGVNLDAQQTRRLAGSAASLLALP